MNKKFCFSGKPGKQYKINGKQEVFQAAVFGSQNRKREWINNK